MPKQKNKFEDFTIKELYNIIDNFNKDNIIKKTENGKPIKKQNLIEEIKKHLTIENGLIKTILQEEKEDDIYEKIINDTEKYHYVGCGSENCKIISSSNSKDEAKEKAINFLKPHWNDMIGNIIFLVIIRKSTEGDFEKEKDILAPEPIYMEISEYIIKKNYKLKFIDSGINSLIWISKDYLKKNKNKIKKRDIEKICEKYKNRELKQGLMSKNIL